jgi:hypothetical protein
LRPRLAGLNRLVVANRLAAAGTAANNIDRGRTGGG